jgi:hypothetical protein
MIRAQEVYQRELGPTADVICPADSAITQQWLSQISII